MTRGLRAFAGILCALAIAALMPAGAAMAQDAKQVKLTDQHVEKFIAAAKELASLPPEAEGSAEKPDPALEAKLVAIVKSAGFAGLDDFNDVATSIQRVMDGLDPQSGEYTDTIDVLNKEIADIKADASIPEKDKQQMLEELAEALKATPPLEHKDNVAVVRKHREALEKVLQ